jgi:ketosteroid isomerase-like protein
MNAGDVQGFIDIVTDDVVFDSPDRPAAIGKDAIRSLCEVIFERFDYDATYPADELVVDRNWAFDRGLWIEKVTPKQGGEQTEVSYGMLQVYRRQADGSWKLARSIWNRKKSSALQGPTPPLASRLSAWLAASHAPFRTPLRAGWRRRGVPSETTSDCG